MKLKNSPIYKIAEELKQKGITDKNINFIDLFYELKEYLSTFEKYYSITILNEDFENQGKRKFLMGSTSKKIALDLESLEHSLYNKNFLTSFCILKQMMEMIATYFYYDYALRLFVVHSVNSVLTDLEGKNTSLNEIINILKEKLDLLRKDYKISEKDTSKIRGVLDDFPLFDESSEINQEASIDALKNILLDYIYGLYMIRSRYSLSKMLDGDFESLSELMGGIPKDSEEFQQNIMNMVKTSSESFNHSYALCCEMVHPNRGSHLTILSDFKEENNKKIIELKEQDESIDKFILFIFSHCFSETYYMIMNFLRHSKLG